MYENYCQIRDAKGMKDADVARAAGITKSTFSDWKSGRSQPKLEKLEKIADVLGVTAEVLISGQQLAHTSTSGKTYYFNDETAEMAQDMYQNEDLRILFRNQRKMSPEDLAAVRTLTEALLRKERLID